MSDTQAYTYWAWLDDADVIREGGFCPTESLADYPNWVREGLRYVEHDLPDLVSETTHYYDAADGTIKPREEVLSLRSTAPADLPPHPKRVDAVINHLTPKTQSWLRDNSTLVYFLIAQFVAIRCR